MSDSESSPPVIGILLAAGRGARFDPSGAQDKLMQTLADGTPVALAAARTLHAALPHMLAVVRPGAGLLAACLEEEGYRTAVCPDAATGMGRSLVHALTQTPHAAGWVIALADMPYVQTATIAALAEAIRQGADIAVPVYRERRGNPVAFSRLHLTALLNLDGDQGARHLLRQCPVREIPVDDPGIVRDIDTLADLDR